MDQFVANVGLNLESFLERPQSAEKEADLKKGFNACYRSAGLGLVENFKIRVWG